MEILNKIQQGLKAPKGQTNTFGNYRYRSCEDIMEAVKPLLGKAVLVVSDEMVQLGDRYYVKATATLTDASQGLPNPELCGGYPSVSATAYAREPLTKKGMDEAQITGATSSYARKYALNGLFAIDDTKDSDSTNKHGTDSPKQVAQKNGCITSEQKEQLIALYGKKQFSKEEGADFMKILADQFKAEKFDDVKTGDFNKLKKYMEGLL